MNGFCRWVRRDTGAWEAGCDGSGFELQHDQTPKDNGIDFCPRCGSRLITRKPAEGKPV